LDDGAANRAEPSAAVQGDAMHRPPTLAYLPYFETRETLEEVGLLAV